MPTRRIRRKGSKSRKGKGKGRRVTLRRQSGGGCGKTCPSSPTGQHSFNTRGIMPNTCQYCMCDK
jgi:hypothetical protein